MPAGSRSDRLVELFAKEAFDWRFDLECLAGGETTFTGSQIYPRMKQFVESLHHRSLTLRADKNRPPGSLSLHGLTFLPDVEITEFAVKHLAIEVKFLRYTDPSGSLAKAIGQGLLYKSLGFAYSHILVVDCRKNSRQLWTNDSPLSGKLPEGISVGVYAQSSPTCVSLVSRF
jgi:hypothetical protein